MRVAIGDSCLESNTFCDQPMTLERYAEHHLHYCDEIQPHWSGTCSEMAGFLGGAARCGFEVIPTLMAWGMPSGAVTSDAFETLSNELTCRLRSAMPLNGVL